MQIVKGMNNFKEEKNTGFSDSLGYFKQLRIIKYEQKVIFNGNRWYAILENNGNFEEYELNFKKMMDSVIPLTKFKITVKNTPFGDIELTEFKSLQSYSILETLPENLLEYMDNL